jgi:hypothetical protein
MVIALSWLSTPAAAQDPPGGKQPPAARPAPPKAPSAPQKAPAEEAPNADEAADADEAAPEEAPDAKADEATESACPPGAFCEQTEVEPPESAGEVAGDKTTSASEQAGTTVRLPPPRQGDDPRRPRTFTYVPDPDGGPGQVIIYEDGAGPPRSEIDDVPAPPKRRWHRHRRWGLNLRVDGILLPRTRGEVDGIGMAGLGLGIRYRPVPAFALDLSGDFVGGVDTNGLERQEVPIAASAMIYVNPKSLAQFYLMGGLNWAFARVFSDEVRDNLANGTSDEYTYFGGHFGLGLEFRVSRLVGLGIDGLAFVRTRTDDDQNGTKPEYLDTETGEYSNSSTAGLIRAGVTFWW